MIAGELRKGQRIIIGGEIYEVIDVQRQKIAQRQAHIKTKIRNLKTGKILEKTFTSEEEIKEAEVEMRKSKFIYKDKGECVFMDLETYEEYRVKLEEEEEVWLMDDLEVFIILFEGNPLTVQIPEVVEIEVIDTPPGIRGDTESGGSKPATLKNGVVIQVPLHIKTGEKIKVNTETREYLGRA